MKNKSTIIILVAVVAVLGFLFWKKGLNKESKEMVTEEQTNQESEMTEETTTEDGTVGTDTKTESEYSYENKEFGFAVKLPGLKMTQRTENPKYISSIFIFGVGDQFEVEEQNRIPNTMAVYIWNDELEFNSMKDTGIEEKSEKVNGEKFDVYSFPNEGATSYHYTQKRGDTIYDIGVLDKKNISKFYFLK